MEYIEYNFPLVFNHLCPFDAPFYCNIYPTAMSALFISLLTLVLLLISAFIVLIVLMQRTSQSGGMGAALGGGAAESAFGADTNNVLTKGTIYGIIAFFVIGLALYLFYQSQASDATNTVDAATLISAVVEETEEPAPASEEATAAVDVVTDDEQSVTSDDGVENKAKAAVQPAEAQNAN